MVLSVSELDCGGFVAPPVLSVTGGLDRLGVSAVSEDCVVAGVVVVAGCCVLPDEVEVLGGS